MATIALASVLEDPRFGLFRQDATELEGLVGVVDLWPDETHTLEIGKTDYPIETGASRTDNAVKLPDRVVLQGWVSDLKFFAGGLISLPRASKGKEAWGRVRELAALREPLRLVSQLGVYENMLIVSVDARKNVDTGNALIFTLTLEEVLFSETQIVRLPPVVLDGPAENKPSEVFGGDKQANTPTPSVAATVLDKLDQLYGLLRASLAGGQ